MLTHDEMIELQSEKHNLIDAYSYRSTEEFVLHLIHKFAYYKVASIADNKTVLDLGCNTGYGSEILSKKAKKVVGVDVSPEAISSAKKQYEHRDIDFHLVDGKHLPFNDNTFDIIISCQVIEHIVDYDIYINEIKRVLAPSGVVLFTTPNAFLRLYPGMKPWFEFHVREFNHEELFSLLNKYFSSVQVKGLFADEVLYSIEKNRLTRCKENARKKQMNCETQISSRSAVKKALPNFVVNGIRKILSIRRNLKLKAQINSLKKYHLDDLYYSNDKLDEALDLLALCANDGSVLNDVSNKLSLSKMGV